MTDTTPSFYQDIRPLFSQYDRIKMMFFCDLTDYAQVKAHAKAIYLSLQPAEPGVNPGGWSKLPEVHVMPVGTGPWPQQQIELFGRWIAAGCPEGVAPVTPAEPGPDVPGFLALSRVLTGFEQLDTLGDEKRLAQAYMDQLLAAEPDWQAPLQDLLARAQQAGFENVLQADGHIADEFSAFAPLLRAIALIWYTATVHGHYAKGLSSQYIHGLEWRAIQAHPMGFANANVPFYWRLQPENDNYTGQIAWSARQDS